MAQTFLIVRNPDTDSSLPYLVRVPLGEGIVLRTRETWPRTSKVCCHRHDAPWPDDAEIVEELAVRSCTRRGAAIDLVLERGRENRSQSTAKRPLPAGDYAVESADGSVAAAVERKSLDDLASSLLSGRLKFALAELAALPRAAVVVEDRYSKVSSLTFARPATVADAIAECHATFPTVPIVFADNRALAQEWTYRFFGAALREAHLQQAAEF